MYVPYFVIISLWKKAKPFICTNLNPLHSRMQCAKSAWKWPRSGSEEENFKNLSLYFRYFVIISPSKGGKASFVQTWIPFTQGCFVPSLVEIGPEALEKMKMWKDYDNDDDRQRTNFDQKAHLSPWLRWAKKCLLFDRTTHQRVLYDANQKPLTNEDNSVAFFNLDKGKTVSLFYKFLLRNTSQVDWSGFLLKQTKKTQWREWKLSFIL